MASWYARDKHENMKIFQGPATRSRARTLEEENEEIVALLRRTFKIHVEDIGKEKMRIKEAQKTFLMSIMQLHKAKGTILENLEDSTSNEEERMNLIADGRFTLPLPSKVLAK